MNGLSFNLAIITVFENGKSEVKSISENTSIESTMLFIDRYGDKEYHKSTIYNNTRFKPFEMPANDACFTEYVQGQANVKDVILSISKH